jgi:hypothetical protein
MFRAHVALLAALAVGPLLPETALAQSARQSASHGRSAAAPRSMLQSTPMFQSIPMFQ